MKHYIRHITLSLPVGLALMVSCTSERDVEPYIPQSQEEMKFEVASTGTRTITTTNENIYDQSFMLFGDTKCEIPDSVRSFFFWEPVAYDTISKSWNYSKAAQYWFMGQEHSFVAIHPFIDKNDPQVTILTFEKSKLSFTYTLPEKLEEAKDLLFAVHRRKYSLDNTGPIKFEFTHLLPRINISMALSEEVLMYDRVDKTDTITNPNNKYNEDEFIKVHSIEFNGIKTKASFTFTALPLGTKTSTYAYEKGYLVRDDDRIDSIRVTLKEALKVPNSYKEGADKKNVTYVTALTEDEIVVMLPQKFADDSNATMVVNYSINEDKDLQRRIIIPLKGTEWEEGHSYTYKFLINNVYYGHIIDDGIITVDIDDFRLHGEDGDEDPVGDDSWITDKTDKDHNINYGYEEGNGNCGPV